jgi:N-acetylmuramoyl-L-alanine amidase
MTKYAIDLGHGCAFDGGAVGIETEEFLINSVGKRLIEKLMRLGHTVVECRPQSAKSTRESLRKRCDIANAANADYFISLHANKFNGNANGCECFAMSPSASTIAVNVCEKISALGFFNRGVKSGSHLLVLKETDMPAVLIEMCFIDSKKDISIFDAEKMAIAICLALTGKCPSD